MACAGNSSAGRSDQLVAEPVERHGQVPEQRQQVLGPGLPEAGLEALHGDADLRLMTSVKILRHTKSRHIATKPRHTTVKSRHTTARPHTIDKARRTTSKPMKKLGKGSVRSGLRARVGGEALEQAELHVQRGLGALVAGRGGAAQAVEAERLVRGPVQTLLDALLSPHSGRD